MVEARFKNGARERQMVFFHASIILSLGFLCMREQILIFLLYKVYLIFIFLVFLRQAM